MSPTLTGRNVSIALSLANLCYLRLWAELFCAGTPAQAYFLKVGDVDFLAAAINVVLLAAVFLVATAAARRFGGRHGRGLVVAGFVGVLAAQISGIGPELEPGALALLEWWRRGERIQPIAPVVGLGCLVIVCLRWPERSLAIAVGALYVFFPFIVVTFGRAAWVVATAHPGSGLAARAPAIGTPEANEGSTEGPRVVMIVFDAMGRRHTFEARPDGLVLPAFDRLRRESLDATQVTQAGSKTRLSLPSLISGVRVIDSVPENESELLITHETADGVRTERWSALPNLFRSARELEGIAVMAGWYHPYCRIFPELSACSWYPTRTVGSHGQDTGLLRTVLDQQHSLLPYVNVRRRQVELFQRQRADARRAVVQGGKGIVFLHLMVPHKPWIWDRSAEALTVSNFGITTDGYYDNLVLADRVLGELREDMETAGKWNDTAIVLTSDHVLVRPKRLRDPEDKRVPFFVKIPGQKEGAVYDRPLDAIVAHDLAQALLRGELDGVQEMVEWLDAR